MIVSLDRDSCQGHGRCNALCPEVFDLDEEGFVSLVTDRPRAELAGQVWEAVANCPEQVISLA